GQSGDSPCLKLRLKNWSTTCDALSVAGRLWLSRWWPASVLYSSSELGQLRCLHFGQDNRPPPRSAPQWRPAIKHTGRCTNATSEGSRRSGGQVTARPCPSCFRQRLQIMRPPISDECFSQTGFRHSSHSR